MLLFYSGNARKPAPLRDYFRLIVADEAQDRAEDCGDELIKTAFGFNGNESLLKLEDPGKHGFSAEQYGFIHQRRIIGGPASFQQEV